MQTLADSKRGSKKKIELLATFSIRKGSQNVVQTSVLAVIGAMTPAPSKLCSLTSPCHAGQENNAQIYGIKCNWNMMYMEYKAGISSYVNYTTQK